MRASCDALFLIGEWCVVKVASENKSRKLIFPRILISQNKKHRKGANHSKKIVLNSIEKIRPKFDRVSEACFKF